MNTETGQVYSEAEYKKLPERRRKSKAARKARRKNR